MKYFELGPVVKGKMPSKDISYLELWQSFCSAERNHLYNFGRGCYEEKFWVTILNFGQWFRTHEMLFKEKRIKITFDMFYIFYL